MNPKTKTASANADRRNAGLRSHCGDAVKAKPARKALGQVGHKSFVRQVMGNDEDCTQYSDKVWNGVAAAVARAVRRREPKPVVVFKGFIWPNHLILTPKYLVINRHRQHTGQVAVTVIHPNVNAR